MQSTTTDGPPVFRLQTFQPQPSNNKLNDDKDKDKDYFYQHDTRNGEEERGYHFTKRHRGDLHVTHTSATPKLHEGRPNGSTSCPPPRVDRGSNYQIGDTATVERLHDDFTNKQPFGTEPRSRRPANTITTTGEFVEMSPRTLPDRDTCLGTNYRRGMHDDCTSTSTFRFVDDGDSSTHPDSTDDYFIPDGPKIGRCHDMAHDECHNLFTSEDRNYNLDCRRQDRQLDRPILDSLTTWRTDGEPDYMVAEATRQGPLPLHRVTNVSLTSRGAPVDTGATKNDETDQRESRSKVDKERRSLDDGTTRLQRGTSLITEPAHESRFTPHLPSGGQTQSGRSTTPDQQYRASRKPTHSTYQLRQALLGISKTSNRADLSSRDQELPLHTKRVPRISWRDIDDLVKRTGSTVEMETYQWAKSHIIDPLRLAALHQSGFAPVPQADGSLEADILISDQEQLLSQGYARPLLQEEIPLAYVNLFTEKEKFVLDLNAHVNSQSLIATRRRLITVPWTMNHAEQVLKDTILATREEIILGLQSEGTALFDIDAYYTHFPLPTEAQLFYCYKFRGKYYCLLTIPTGGRHCPSLAQTVSKCISHHVLQEFPLIQILTYLDNFRFAGDQALVQRAVESFQHLTVSLNIKTTCEHHFSDHYTFLGIQCRHANQLRQASTQASEKTLAKLQRNFHGMLDKTGKLTLRRGLRVLGGLIWVSGITAIQLHEHYIPLKFFRRKASSSGLDEPLSLWRCATKPLVRWVALALTNIPRFYKGPVILSPQTHLTLFTDASIDGYGSVAFFIDSHNIPSIKVTMGPWSQILGPLCPHINQLEAFALLIGISTCSELRARTAQMFVDNSTLCCIVNRGYSPRFWANLAAASLHQQLDEMFEDWSIRWISTFENMADMASRVRISRFTAFTETVDKMTMDTDMIRPGGTTMGTHSLGNQRLEVGSPLPHDQLLTVEDARQCFDSGELQRVRT
ncbi:Hypothetical protein, putative [Bodo saltans]|uniref:Reverse transcriptase domain-containing protein n=1 Tax=Bodo saltans TaxID=75058 RepID=A0A0S4JPN3_BODSA|nr:Hypothetical protein, putative [Bodo saltans]|eukprot:CUG92085.1 Hypothetical protein, putative [Bodo saltans]